jgi:hypothetical protein
MHDATSVGAELALSKLATQLERLPEQAAQRELARLPGLVPRSALAEPLALVELVVLA